MPQKNTRAPRRPCRKWPDDPSHKIMSLTRKAIEPIISIQDNAFQSTKNLIFNVWNQIPLIYWSAGVLACPGAT